MYGFLLNMWITKKIDEAYLNQVTLINRITEEERDIILATLQND